MTDITVMSESAQLDEPTNCCVTYFHKNGTRTEMHFLELSPTTACRKAIDIGQAQDMVGLDTDKEIHSFTLTYKFI